MTEFSFGRSILGHPEAALRREWIVTNGLGGYAMGSLMANAPTRKYHGYLIAALKPPVMRTNLVGGLLATARYADQIYELSGFEWSDSSLNNGFRTIDQWRLDDGIPSATFALAEARLVQRIWMEHGANTTYVQWEYLHGRDQIDLHLKPLLTERDHHTTETPSDWQPAISVVDHGAEVSLSDGVVLKLLSDYATWTTNGTEWLDNLLYRLETYRGYPDTSRLLIGGEWYIGLKPGGSVTLVFSTEPEPDPDGMAARERAIKRAQQLLEAANLASDAPAIAQQLVLAADQFVVRREVSLPDDTVQPGVSVIAGYPWFSDWGRDTMIALPGLFLATGRSDMACQTLRTWSHFINQGMIPNRFPDQGAEPEYNTVDATLWFIQAIRATYGATGDKQLLQDLFPSLEEIVRWHQQGTRYGIRVASDGLLQAGEPHVQLTWMDAKYKDWVVTPREGKAVEINALWYSALRCIAEFARELDQPERASTYDREAERVLSAFERFWNAERGYLYDVLDGPNGDDPALRPNQLFAVSMAHPPLSGERARAVVDACERHLATSVGMRSLAPFDAAYIGVYGGDLEQRDGAYHQGTTWGWLMGPFISAYRQVHGAQAARRWLVEIQDHLLDAGIGSISEIFDGLAPWTPRGCPWQAWSVAEWLRCWREL